MAQQYTSFRLVQYPNASSSIVATELPIVMVVRLLQRENVPTSMLVTEFPIIILDRLEHP